MLPSGGRQEDTSAVVGRFGWARSRPVRLSSSILVFGAASVRVSVTPVRTRTSIASYQVSTMVRAGRFSGMFASVML